MKNKDKIKRKFRLVEVFSFIVATIMIIMAVITHIGMVVINNFIIDNLENYVIWLLVFEVAGTIVGTATIFIVSRRMLQPLQLLMEGTDKITSGDYSVRLDMDSFYEFEELGRKFNCMAEELKSVEVLRNDFVNQFSHEFNTPISSIHGFANALKDRNLGTDEWEAYLDKIIQGTDRLSNLANNVLNLSLIERQTIVTHKTRINITEQIRRVIAMLVLYWEKKEIIFDFECDEHYIIGNEEFLEHLWCNILDNAIKYSFVKGKIDINIEEKDDNVIVKIRDYGKGIAEESIPHIFEKFYRSKSSSTSPGTGIGLTIAKKVVLLHQGSIEVDSKVGGGTSFFIKLPCADCKKSVDKIRSISYSKN